MDYYYPAILQELSLNLYTSFCNNCFDVVYFTMLVTHVVAE